MMKKKKIFQIRSMIINMNFDLLTFLFIAFIDNIKNNKNNKNKSFLLILILLLLLLLFIQFLYILNVRYLLELSLRPIFNKEVLFNKVPICRFCVLISKV